MGLEVGVSVKWSRKAFLTWFPFGQTPEMKAQIMSSSGEGAFQVSGTACTKAPKQDELVFSRNHKKASMPGAE